MTLENSHAESAGTSLSLMKTIQECEMLCKTTGIQEEGNVCITRPWNAPLQMNNASSQRQIRPKKAN
jgi:hypothetical protein